LNTLAPVYGDVVTIAEVLGSYRIHGSNRWSSNGSDLSRLPRRIEDRLLEVAILRQHAKERSVPLPSGNALDHEIAFINYRMMAKKLGLSYEGSGADSEASLLQRAFEVLRQERYPLRLSLAHGVWFGVLALAPQGPARQLIRLRFERTALKGSLDRAYRRAMNSLPAPLGRRAREPAADGEQEASRA
jgi:hypothetical protein